MTNLTNQTHIYYNTKTAAQASLAPLWDSHRRELHGSAIGDELAELNFTSLEGDAALDRLLYSDSLDRDNLGRVRSRWLRRYDHCRSGGWWFSGIDLLSGQPADNGCFKPLSPRTDREGKTIKYEAPPREPSAIYAPRLTWRHSRHIVERTGSDEARAAWAERYEAAERPDLSSPDDGFWLWACERSDIPATVTEGAKKVCALVEAGYLAVGLQGVWNGAPRPRDANGDKVGEPYLVPELEALAASGRSICFGFDNDSKPKTVSSVNRAIFRTGRLFEQYGCPIYIIRWFAPEKGVDDLVAARGIDAFDAAYASAVPLKALQALNWQRLTFEPNLCLNHPNLDGVEIPLDQRLPAVKAPKGGRKTSLIERRVELARRLGQPVLVLTANVVLSRELCDRFGVEYITELHNSGIGGILGYGLCINSLHSESAARFNSEAWRGAVVIIDECEQVLWAALASETLRQHRIPVLQSLQRVCQLAAQIVLADADLSDFSLNYIRDLARTSVGEAPPVPYLIENRYRAPDAAEVVVYTDDEHDDPSGLYRDLIETLTEAEEAKAAGRSYGAQYIATTGQQSRSLWGTKSLEADIRKRFPKLSVIRIDGESVADPEHPAYCATDNLNGLLAQADVAIASPTLVSGVSITIERHFDSIWGIFQGSLSEPQIRQQLGRVREQVPRYIWAPQRGFGRVAGGETSPTKLAQAQQRRVQQHLGELQQAGLGAQDLELDEGDSADALAPDPLHLKAWARGAAALNAGIRAYKATLAANLEAEGHPVRFNRGAASAADSRTTKDKIKETRDGQYQQRCKQTADAPSPDERRYSELQNKRSRTDAENLEAAKGDLERFYRVEVTPDLIDKDDRGWRRKLATHFYLTRGRDQLPERERRRLKRKRRQGGGAVWMPDLNAGEYLTRVRALEGLGVVELLAKERIGPADRAAIADRARRGQDEVKEFLGINVSDRQSDTQIVQTILGGTLELQMPYLGWAGPRGNRERIHGTPAPPRKDPDPVSRSEERR